MFENLHPIIQNFLPSCHCSKVEPLGKGHINHTYKVTLSGDKCQYVLQRINMSVFANPLGLAITHSKLWNYWAKEPRELKVARVLPSALGNLIHTDQNGEAWRLSEFIADSYSIDVATESWQAYEAGGGFGWFLNLCSSLDPTGFEEAIQDFHSVSHRLNQLDDAMKQDLAGRLESVGELVHFFNSRHKKMLAIEELLKSGRIPMRVVHNDTKISNLLFRHKKAVAIIDLDTVGPGSLLYDYGDALRTVASTAPEDEKNRTKVNFCLERFSNFTAGFAKEVNGFITKEEIKHLCVAPALMTFIMGVRFLADYLNGDVYYKVSHENHNLERALVQKKLIEDIESKEFEMRQVINAQFDY